MFVFCRIGAKYTKKRRFWTPWYDPYQVGTARSYQVGTTRSYQTWYGPYQIWYAPYHLVQAVPDLADSHLVRPTRTTLVRAVHNCRLTEFKSWQRLFIAGDLSIFEDSIPDQIESSEKERKRAKEQGEKKKEEGRGESRRINFFSTPDLRSSSIMPLFISLFVFLDRSMTCE